MKNNLYEEQIKTKKMHSKWLFYLIPVYISLITGAVGTGMLAYHSIADKMWTIAIIMGCLFGFFLWIIVKIFLLSRTKTPTKIIGVAEDTYYKIYAINEWSEEEKVIEIPYDRVQILLIGVWTNRNFKGKRNDIVGARFILYHPGIEGVNHYTSSVAVDEEVLKDWTKRIETFHIPTVVTPMIIADVKPEQFDHLFQTVKTVPFDGSFTIKEYFEKQEKFSQWQA